MPTEAHPWIGLCLSHFSSWQRSMVPFQDVSTENLYGAPESTPSLQTHAWGKKMYSLNIIKHIKYLFQIMSSLSSQSLRLQLQGHKCPPSLQSISHRGPLLHAQCQCPLLLLMSTIGTTQTGFFIPALLFPVAHFIYSF